MRDGQLALPHGYGQTYPTETGERLSNGPRVNALTESGSRDPIAGTSYHKHVAVRLERLAAAEAAAYEEQSRRIHLAPDARGGSHAAPYPGATRLWDGDYLPIITSEDLITAETVSPTFSARSSTASLVIAENTVRPGASSTFT